MNPEVTLDAVSNIIAAVIGGIIGLTPYLATVFRARREKNTQHYKFFYVKLYHLTRRSATSRPVYKRFIQRLNTHVDVYDEAHYFRLNIFDKEQDDFTTVDRSSGVVDLQLLYPWQKLQFSDWGAEKVPNMITHTIKKKSHTFFTRSMYFNGFQEGNTDVAMKMESDTREARMIIDFSSIPGFEMIFKSSPRAYLRTSGMEGPIDITKVHPGIYVVSHNDLQKEDVIIVVFDVDWDIVDQRAQMAIA
jgi:hypothetical protein